MSFELKKQAFAVDFNSLSSQFYPVLLVADEIGFF